MQKPSLKKYRTKAAFVFVCMLFPLTLWAFMASGAKNYGFISLVMVILAIIPFLMLYEMKKPKAREWIPLAVMAAIAAVGRAAFAFVPHFKPTSAIIVITAMVFGPEAGFLTGAIAALASNLFFGQGPWTPWQMFAWGFIGFLAGLLSKAGRLKKKWELVVFGICCGYIYGWILNIWNGAGFVYGLSWQTYLSLCVTSLLPDGIHSAATVIFLLLLSDSWGSKLRRVKNKFGILSS